MADERYRTLIETPEFSAQFDAIIERHSLSVIGPVLDGLLWGIASNPKEYDRGTWNIRIAKSRALGLTVPRLQIYFQVQNEGQSNEAVLLLWVEESSPTNELGESIQ